MKTPDPAVSTEAIAALLVALATNLIVLFGLDLTDAQTGALVGVVNGLVVVGYFVHGLYVRRGRAEIAVAKIDAQASLTRVVAPVVAPISDLGDAPPSSSDVTHQPLAPVDVAGEVAAS